MSTRGCTKWSRSVGHHQRAGNEPQRGNGWECWWCITGRPPEFSCDWFEEKCWRCQARAALRPEVRNAKTPTQLHAERYGFKYRQQRIAAALVGAPERVAAYLAKVRPQAVAPW